MPHAPARRWVSRAPRAKAPKMSKRLRPPNRRCSDDPRTLPPAQLVLRPRWTGPKTGRALFRGPLWGAEKERWYLTIRGPNRVGASHFPAKAVFSAKVPWLVSGPPARSGFARSDSADVPDGAPGWVVESTSSQPVMRSWASSYWSLKGAAPDPQLPGTGGTLSGGGSAPWSTEILRGADRFRPSLVERREESQG